MPRRKPSPNFRPSATTHAATNARQLIASAAARLMAEDGIDDYGLAKRKAAHQLGADPRTGLPGNDEIERELRNYQALFQEEEQPERLRELRQAAVNLMHLLREFHPYLTGAVLDGTAGRYATIELDIFADSSKDVEIMLLSNNIRYQSDENLHHGHNAAETRLHLDWEACPVSLTVFPLTAERSHPRNVHTGRARARAAPSAVAALLLESRSPP